MFSGEIKTKECGKESSVISKGGMGKMENQHIIGCAVEKKMSLQNGVFATRNKVLKGFRMETE